MARLVGGDVARAVSLAESTPLPVLKDSIFWYAARNRAGREQLVQRMKALNGDQTARLLGLVHFSLQGESSLPKPAGWEAIRDRFTGSGAGQTAPETRRLCEELSAVFGDETVLKKMRMLLASEQAPVEERRSALAILSRTGDRESVALYPRLL